MKELLCGEDVSLLNIPHGDMVWGVALPFTGGISKDGLAVLQQKDAKYAGRFLRVNRKLGEYVTRWGNKTFYLGTYKNDSGGLFRLCSIPVKHEPRGSSDLTLITKSFADLVVLCDRFGVQTCLFPMLGEDLGMASFIHCIKPALELQLDNRFIMVHRGGVCSD